MKLPFWRQRKKKNGKFLKSFSAQLSEKMHVPIEFARFFEWAESNGCVGTTIDGDQFIVVDPIVLGLNYVSSLTINIPTEDEWWLGSANTDYHSRLKIFARTGADGSSAAFWIDDDGKQQIVHLGSGTGSVMIGKWVNNPLDFLRLIAIGYDELCWPENYNKKPQDLLDPEETFQAPTSFAQWLQKEFAVSVPQTAIDIVNKMSEIGEESDDPFCNWVGSINPP